MSNFSSITTLNCTLLCAQLLHWCWLSFEIPGPRRDLRLHELLQKSFTNLRNNVNTHYPTLTNAYTMNKFNWILQCWFYHIQKILFTQHLTHTDLIKIKKTTTINHWSVLLIHVFLTCLCSIVAPLLMSKATLTGVNTGCNFRTWNQQWTKTQWYIYIHRVSHHKREDKCIYIYK